MPTKPIFNISTPALWVAIAALCLLVIVVVLLTRSNGELIQPQILSSSPQGQHLQMPSNPKGSWQKNYVAPAPMKRQQVLQQLSEIRARYKQLRPEIRIFAQPGLATRQRFARQLADALSHYHLGQLAPGSEPGITPVQLEGAVILLCAEKDQIIARELLGALAPYLSGRVFLRFDEATAAHRMQLHLIGTPWFDEQGLVTFEPQ